MTEERHEQDLPQLRGQQHGHVVDVHRVRGCAVSSWTLRPRGVPALRQGEKQTHPAAVQAARYVRLRQWQFHQAGRKAAVRDLTTVEEMFRGFADRIGLALNVPVELALSYEDAAEAVTPVVGWRTPHSGLLLCLKHPRREAAPVWHAPEGATCAVCGDGLGVVTVPTIPPAECDGCGHAHVQGIRCVSGDLYECGCTG